MTRAKFIDPPAIEADIDVDSFEVSIDEDTGIHSFELCDGRTLGVVEPKAGHFLRVDAWRNNAPDDMNSDMIAGFRLLYNCINVYKPVGQNAQPKPSFDAFLDSLEMTDIERVGAVLKSFRSFNEFVAKSAAKL